jgi:hypothetical protein
MERRSEKISSSVGTEKMERLVTDKDKMERYCLRGQSPQRAVAPTEEEEDFEVELERNLKHSTTLTDRQPQPLCTNVVCFRRVLPSHVNMLCYLWVRQTTTLSQHPSVEAELANYTPQKINEI